MPTSDEFRPEVFRPDALQPRPGRPTGRVIVPPGRDPAGPAFFEWELCGEEWSDEHPFDEWVYVLDGELHVESGGEVVVCATGALVRVPAGSRGAYRAPGYARVLSVYGPRPAGEHDPRGVLRSAPVDPI